MQQFTVRLLAACTVAIPLVTSTHTQTAVTRAAAFAPYRASHLGQLTAALARPLAVHPTSNVIVLLRTPSTGPLAGIRAAVSAASQGALLRELAEVHAHGVLPYQLINAVAATVSPAEARRLAADPAVQAVFPNSVIRLPASPAAAPLPPVPGLTTLQPRPVAPACTSSKTPSLEPEALQLTHTASNSASAQQERHLHTASGAAITGAGVKVAFIADGIDPNNPEFIRPNGQHVFVDYKDFSSDGPSAPTTGGEAFLDAGSIAAQGRKVYNVNTYLVNPLPKPCLIRIEGMAPGVSLVGLKVFAQNNSTTTAAFVEAIDYAVNVDHVNVLNESFGSNPFPDLSKDPISLANAAAVAAGVTVTVSSGDAGVNSTLGSPATASEVLNVGATTQYRAYSQINGSGITLGNGGYIDNNIAGFSSAGFSTIGPRTVDVVAPGDSGWAPCTPSFSKPPAFADCTNLGNKPTSFQLIGGTSESAPLTAGEAALVIQAYRSAHHGASPSPAVVKRIIMSSATDLGIPAQEQGAGLIDSYRAVQLALSYRDSRGTPAPHAAALLSTDVGAYSATANPGTTRTFTFTVTNNGSVSQLVSPKVRSLTKVLSSKTYMREFDPLAQPNYFFNERGSPRTYIQQDFPVPAGTQQLRAAISYTVEAQTSAVVALDLFDPQGRLASISGVNGAGPGYDQLEVRNPQPGTWHAILFSRDKPEPMSYHGPVQITVTNSAYAPSGSVAPASRLITPGHTAAFTATVHTPGTPGDRGDEIVFPSPGGTTTLLGALPVSLRSLVPISAAGGAFSGTLLGGNGRAGAPGQQLSYQFDVPAGLHDLDLSVRIADPNSNLEGVLVDPSGEPVDVQTTVAAIDQQANPTFYTGGMQFTRANPVAGRYLFVLLINKNIAGTVTSQTFEGKIAFNQVRYKTRGIPASPRTVLKAGKAVPAQILVLNTGITTKDYFVDARLNAVGPVPLLAPYSFSTTMPITAQQQLPVFFIPPHVTEADFSVDSPTPINLDVFTGAGAPPYGGTGNPETVVSSGTSINAATGLYQATASVVAPEVASTVWAAYPSLVGPFPAGAPPSTVEVRASAIGQPFDRSVSVSTGNPVSPFSSSYTPLTLPPQSADVIDVHFLPQGAPGTVVSGTLYVETFNQNSTSGDEIAAIPYAYSIGK